MDGHVFTVAINLKGLSEAIEDGIEIDGLILASGNIYIPDEYDKITPEKYKNADKMKAVFSYLFGKDMIRAVELRIKFPQYTYNKVEDPVDDMMDLRCINITEKKYSREKVYDIPQDIVEDFKTSWNELEDLYNLGLLMNNIDPTTPGPVIDLGWKETM